MTHKKWRENPTLLLLLACYAGGLVVFLLAHLAGLAANRVAYANGSLAPAALALADFDLHELEPQPDGTLLSVGGDPQLLLRDAARRVENVTIHFEYTLPPLLVNTFWASPGQDFSLRRMAYPRQGQPEGQPKAFLLPATGGQSLRIDPGTRAGNRIAVHSIVINQKRPFFAFFVPSAGEVALLAVLPGLLACGLSLAAQWGPVQHLWQGLWPRRKKAGDAHG